MRYLITGTPHSGTRYMCMLFRSFGFDVGHEGLGRDGTSCWSWAVDDEDPPWSPGPRMRHATPRWTLIHVYRDPFVCIPAMAEDVKPKTIAFLCRHLGIKPDTPPLARAAWTWIRWNEIISRQRPNHTVRVEDAERYFSEWFNRAPDAPPGRRVNTRSMGQRKPVALADLEQAIPPGMVAEICKTAEALGYEVPTHA